MYRIGSAHLYPNYCDLDGLDDVGVNPSTVLKFYRIEIYNSLYYCSEYKRATKTNNHTVIYQDLDSSKKVAVVCYYLELNNDDGSCIVVAVIKPLNTTAFKQGPITVHHLYEVLSEGSVVCIPVEWIKEKCIFMELDRSTYVAKIYNHHKLTL